MLPGPSQYSFKKCLEMPAKIVEKKGGYNKFYEQIVGCVTIGVHEDSTSRVQVAEVDLDGPVCVRIRHLINLAWSSDDNDASLDDDDELVEGVADGASNSVLDRFICHLMDVC